MKKLMSIVLAASAISLAVPNAAHAFTHTVNCVNETTYGPAKVAEMRGRFTLARGETLVQIRVNALDANGRVVSSAQGIFNTRRGTWRGGVGDFRMVHYHATFTVRTPTGTRTFTTRTYHW
ncbi:MAG: hypothetical protein KF864_04535 [Phycisphaeraceae bacterium]|nr:hypothetical protein [Phycisphaeraceae bacterium]